MDKSNKIKNSFEQLSFEDSVTDGTWDKISSKLDASSKPIESDNKIKESFESIQHQENLTLLWDEIETTLEVNKVWSKIKKSLEKNSKFNRRKKRSMQLGLAMFLLLCFRTCTPEYASPVYNTSNHQRPLTPPVVKESLKTVDNALLAHIVPSNTNIRETKGGRIYTFMAGTLLPLKEKKQLKLLPYRQVARPLTQVLKPKYTPKQKKPSKLSFESINISKNNSLSKSANLPTKDGLLDPLQRPLKTATKTAVQSRELRAPTNTYDTNVYSAIEGVTTQLALLEVANQLELISPVPPLEYAQNLIALKVQDSFILAALPIEIKKIKPKPHVEIGLIGKLGSSILVGATTAKAMELTSMVKTRILPATGFGMSFNYFINDHNSFYVHIFPFVSTKQYFGGYSREGRFYNKEIKINYFEFFIGYQRNLIHYHLLGKKSSLYLRTDYSLGYLSKSEEEVNNQSVNILKKHQDIDHRIGLSLGSRHQMNHIILDYGLNGYLSLAPSIKAHPDISTSNTLIFGAYIGIYYTL